MAATQILSEIFSGAGVTLLGGAICAAVTGIGSARAVGSVGQVASGALTENPDSFGKLVVLQALPGTQGIYGLVIWLLTMVLSNFQAAGASMSLGKGFLYLLCTLPMTLVGYWSAVYQGRVAADGIGLVARRPEDQTKALTMAAMVETYAILALLVSILSMIFVGSVNL